MRILLIPAALLVLAGCATPQKAQEIEAVRDFVAANELEQVERVRYRFRGDLKYRYVNDRYVKVEGRDGDFLVEFRRNCPELRDRIRPETMSGPLQDSPLVDKPRDANVLNARFDTIKGCRIAAIYGLTPEQYEELDNLGDAPGEEIFLPDEEQG